MGMSTGIYGLKPPDETWKKMKTILDACKAGGVEPPPRVSAFFEEEPDGDNGQRVEIPWKKWEGNGETGIEIEVAKIPKDVKIIRFYNSW